MRLGLAEKLERKLPRYFGHLSWVLLYGLRHPLSLIREDPFAQTLREKSGNVSAGADKYHPARYRRYSNRRVGNTTKQALFANLASVFEVKDTADLAAMPNKPGLDLCIVDTGSIRNRQVIDALGDTPLVLVTDSSTTQTQLDELANSSKITAAIALEPVQLASKNFPIITPSKSSLETQQSMEQLSQSKPEKSERAKLEILIAQARQHHDVQVEVFEQLLKALSLPLVPMPKISVLAPTNRPENVANILKTYNEQSYPNKELLLVLHGVKLTKELENLTKDNREVKVVSCSPDAIFGDCLNEGVEAASGYLVAKIDDDDIYGEDHLYDLYYAWQNTGADIVGKWGHYVFLESENKYLQWHHAKAERFGGHLPGGTILTTKSLLHFYKFASVRNAIDAELLTRLKRDARSIYSTIPYNYVRVRHQNGHTWQKTDQEFIAESDCAIENTDEQFYRLDYTNAVLLVKQAGQLES